MATVKKYAKRLRIYLGETDPYQEIVKKAREMDLAGATVFRGLMGYGENNRQIRSARLVELSSDLPIVVEIVDSAAYIEKFLPYLDTLIKKGMITIDDVEIIKYGKHYVITQELSQIDKLLAKPKLKIQDYIVPLVYTYMHNGKYNGEILKTKVQIYETYTIAEDKTYVHPSSTSHVRAFL